MLSVDPLTNQIERQGYAKVKQITTKQMSYLKTSLSHTHTQLTFSLTEDTNIQKAAIRKKIRNVCLLKTLKM